MNIVEGGELCYMEISWEEFMRKEVSVAADARSLGAHRFSLSVKVSGLQRWCVKDRLEA